MDTSSTVLVKPLAKGQITIPVGFRKQLGITRSSYLKAEVKAGKLILSPVQLAEEEKYLRSYSDKQIKDFLAADKLDKKTYAKVKRYLSK